MVICPWCGTNYTTFQSNCSRCGGPIQAAASVSSVSMDEEVTMPPPPPREISDNYRWKLMRSDAWSQGSIVFALLGVIFTLVGFVLTIAIITAFVGIPFLGMGLLFLGGGGYVLYWRYNEALKAVNILKNGEAVIGQVTDAQTNFTVAVNGRNPLTISYQFRAEGRDIQSSITTLNHLNVTFQPGKPVCVLYLPDAPDYNSLYPHP